MAVKDEILYIETTQNKHESWFNIIKAYMDGKYLSKNLDRSFNPRLFLIKSITLSSISNAPTVNTKVENLLFKITTNMIISIKATISIYISSPLIIEF